MKTQNEMQLARGRLRGALNETLLGSEDDSNAAEEDLPHRGRPPKYLASVQRELQSPRSSRQSSLSPGKYLTPTKRRKREQQSSAANSTAHAQQLQKIQAESFVMKLFDRSLDLSKYTEQTSLYPICRAWIANQPRNPSIRNYREQRSPSPVERERNAGEVLAKLRRGELRELRAMPTPQAAELPKLPAPNLAGPEATQRLQELDSAVTGKLKSKAVEGKEELLAKHVGAWKQIKSNWMKHSKSYQKRYELNHLIIQELFKP